MKKTPVKVYYYYDLTDTDFFCRLLEKRFRETGHDRQMEFINWNCYKTPPGDDGDIYIYDAVAMTALVERGFLHELPDIINVSDMFGWTIDKSKVRKKTYGVPLMMCSNVLICRREDDRGIRNVLDLAEPVAIPLRTMFMYYYLQAFCNYQDRSGRDLAVMKRLVELTGHKGVIETSTLKDYDGIRKFNQRECRYFLGFTENLRLFDPGDYVVRLANFSEHNEDQMPLFMVDYASISNRVEEEKLLDCLDLLEIMTDPQFIYELCTAGGELHYMLPACRSVYGDLAKADPLYNELYQMLLPEENGVFRYGGRFYKDFYKRSDELLRTVVEGMASGDLEKERSGNEKDIDRH